MIWGQQFRDRCRKGVKNGRGGVEGKNVIEESRKKRRSVHI